MHRGNRDRAALALARPVPPRWLKSPPGQPRMNACTPGKIIDYGNKRCELDGQGRGAVMRILAVWWVDGRCEMVIGRRPTIY